MQLATPSNTHLDSYELARLASDAAAFLASLDERSQGVIEKAGGVLFERYTQPAAHGSKPGLR